MFSTLLKSWDSKMVLKVSGFSSSTTSNLCAYRQVTQPLWASTVGYTTDGSQVECKRSACHVNMWSISKKECMWKSHAYSPWRWAGGRRVCCQGSCSSERVLQLWADNLQSPLSPTRMTRRWSQSLHDTGCLGILLGEVVGWGDFQISPLAPFNKLLWMPAAVTFI